MRKFAVTLMTSLLVCSAASAFWPEATDSALEVGVGYRQDSLEWKTRSHFDSSYSGCSGGSGYSGFNEGSYNCDDEFCNAGPIRAGSHLKWRDLNIVQIDINGRYVTCDNLYLRFNADYGWITSGKNRDTDTRRFGGDNFYNFDNGSEWARSH
jgi:hypothetical protein